MVDCLLPAGSREPSIPIHAVTPADLAAGTLDARTLEWAGANDFKAKGGIILAVPDAHGALGSILFGLGGADAAENSSPLVAGKLSATLPEGCYRLAGGFPDPALSVLAWALGAYRFTRYRPSERKAPRLIAPDGVDAAAVSRIADGVYLARDLINTAANDMGPAELAAATIDLAGAMAEG